MLAFLLLLTTPALLTPTFAIADDKAWLMQSVKCIFRLGLLTYIRQGDMYFKGTNVNILNIDSIQFER
ncbi:hypothetical protein WG68_11175 [Arsukibacterium ikkense]|uniref:Uncharacterized protein n=1 Tax=Arsukibacterium ikkense TaxID=336831 RepID=A0A0M2V4E8_9GAMM|nr:hypothetical protein WG68_11175 [Arsukibacterium ikkense]